MTLTVDKVIETKEFLGSLSCCRPDKLNNTHWMNLNILDYIIVEAEGISALVTNHPSFPKDNRGEDVLWRIQIVINKVHRHICWYADPSSRENSLEYAKKHVVTAIERQLMNDAKHGI